MKIADPKPFSIFSIAVLIIAGIIFSGNSTHAALQSHVVSGTVTAVNHDNNTIEITNPSGSFVGEAPNEYAIEALSPENPVIAVSLGSKGGDWVFIGKLDPTNTILTSAYGDIAFIRKENCDEPGGGDNFCDIRVRGNFQFQYTNTPDCSNCSGCNCEASQTALTISGPDDRKTTQNLQPGETFTHEEQGYNVHIIFISGEGPAYPQCTDQPCAGPQAVSSFAITIETENDDSSCFIRVAGSDFLGHSGRNGL